MAKDFSRRTTPPRSEPAATTVSVDVVSDLLDLGLDDSPHALGAAGRLLSAAGLDEPQVAALRDRLQEIRAAVAHYRRRELELSTSAAWVREVARLHQIDEVVSSLVDNAHALMGTDVTYLSEFDQQSRELKVRACSGAVSPAFLELRVLPGTGLAGQVAERRRAEWTSDYSKSVDFRHEEGLDVATTREGLVAILAVPLVVGSKVLGVLFAANRRPHHFTHDEVALLSGFADNVSVVLEWARLLEQARKSAEATTEAYAQLEVHAGSVERASAVHEQLTEVVLRGGDSTEVTAVLAQALRADVLALDPDGRLIASHGDGVDLRGGLPETVAAAIRESYQSGHIVELTEHQSGTALVFAIRAGALPLGALFVARSAEPLTPTDMRTIERTGQTIALLALKQDAVVHAEERVRGELLADLLSNDPRRQAEIAARLQARRLHAERLNIVVLLSVDVEHRTAAASVARAMCATEGLSGTVDGRTALLLPGTDGLDLARRVTARMRRGLPESPRLLVVASSPTSDLGQLGRHYEQARDCLMLSEALGMNNGTVDADLFLPYTAMFAHDAARITSFITLTIGSVLRWDQQRGTELMTTLRTVIEANGSPSKAARALHIHTNTVLQRLERINRLLGADWRDPDPFFRVSVATRLHCLIEKVRSES